MTGYIVLRTSLRTLGSIISPGALNASENELPEQIAHQCREEESSVHCHDRNHPIIH